MSLAPVGGGTNCLKVEIEAQLWRFLGGSQSDNNYYLSTMRVAYGGGELSIDLTFMIIMAYIIT